MKKLKTKSNKNVTSKTTKKGGKKSVKKERRRSSSKFAKGNRTGKEKSKPSAKDKKLISKNTNRKNVGRSKKDDELDLLQELFLKELQQSGSKKRPSKQKLKFERRSNKDNKRLRGNVFVISFPERSSFQQKINLVNDWDGKELKYYVDRFSKLPQAIHVILTTKKGKEFFSRASRISPFDFVVNVPNTKKFILEMMVSFQDNYIEYIESDEPRDSDWVYNPGKIKMVTVRFIY